MKTTIAWVIVILLIVAGVWYYMTMKPVAPVSEAEPSNVETETAEQPGLTGVWYGGDTSSSPAFTREFRADGTIEDRFATFPSVEGEWEVLTAAEAEKLGLAAGNGQVIRIEYPEEAFYMIAKVAGDTLTLQYPSAEYVLTFNRQ